MTSPSYHIDLNEGASVTNQSCTLCQQPVLLLLKTHLSSHRQCLKFLSTDSHASAFLQTSSWSIDENTTECAIAACLPGALADVFCCIQDNRV